MQFQGEIDDHNEIIRKDEDEMRTKAKQNEEKQSKQEFMELSHRKMVREEDQKVNNLREKSIHLQKMIHNEEHPTSRRISSKSPQKRRSPSKKSQKFESSLNYSKNKKSETEAGATFGERRTPEMFPEES